MEEKLGKLTKLISEIDDPKAKLALEAVMEILDDITNEIGDINDDLDSIDEALQIFDEDLSEVENAVFADDDRDGEEPSGCGCGHEGCNCEEDELEVACPNCGTLINLESPDIERIKCPNCGVMISVDYEYSCEEFDE